MQGTALRNLARSAGLNFGTPRLRFSRKLGSPAVSLPSRGPGVAVDGAQVLAIGDQGDAPRPCGRASSAEFSRLVRRQNHILLEKNALTMKRCIRYSTNYINSQRRL